MTDAIETTITGYERLNNTPDGNPRWLLRDAGGMSYRTAADSTAGHVVNDQRYPARVRLVLTPQGRVTSLEYLDE